MVAAAAAGAGLVGSFLSADAASGAASDASNAQTAASNAGIAQQNKQFETIQNLLNPYVQAGYGGLQGQQTLLGMNGTGEQQSAITALQNSPQFQSMLQQGQNSILQNASATGGLRGGNVQGALAQYSPQLLSQMIQQQFSNLGNMTSLGQNAAAGVGNAGMSAGNNITNLLGQQGSYAAGNSIAQGNAQIGMYNGLAGSIGLYGGMQNQQTLLNALTGKTPSSGGFNSGAFSNTSTTNDF